MELPEITRATAMHLEPGDVLFLTIEEALDEDEVKHVKAAIDRELPGVKCLILMGGIDLAGVHAFASSARPDGVLEVPGGLSAEEVAHLSERFVARHSGGTE